MSRKCNLVLTIVILAYFISAFVFLMFFNGCANPQCYPQRYGESICQLDNKATANAKSQRL